MSILPYSSWAKFKALKNSSGKQIYFRNESSNYLLFLCHDGMVFKCILKPGSDFNDFENNFKSGATEIT